MPVCQWQRRSQHRLCLFRLQRLDMRDPAAHLCFAAAGQRAAVRLYLAQCNLVLGVSQRREQQQRLRLHHTLRHCRTIAPHPSVLRGLAAFLILCYLIIKAKGSGVPPDAAEGGLQPGMGLASCGIQRSHTPHFAPALFTWCPSMGQRQLAIHLHLIQPAVAHTMTCRPGLVQRVFLSLLPPSHHCSRAPLRQSDLSHSGQETMRDLSRSAHCCYTRLRRSLLRLLHLLLLLHQLLRGRGRESSSGRGALMLQF